MKKYLSRVSSEIMVAIITVVVVASANVWILSQSDTVSGLNLSLAITGFVLFVITFLFLTRDKPYRRDTATRWTLLAGEYALVLAVFAVSPLSFNAILLVIWSGQLPYFLPYRQTVLWSPVWSAIPWLFYIMVWGQTDWLWLSAILFWTFNLFSLKVMESRKAAELATEQAQQANRELRALQDLMQQASRKDERTRIARDIHDLVGHHLTALSLHLQVASRTAAPAQKPTIDQCLSIARLLLSDVREAVSDMREYGQLDLLQALKSLTDPLAEQINVKVNCECDLSELTLMQATTLLRCIQESLTNSLRHGKASALAITITRCNNQLLVDVKDNGSAQPFTPGNGLAGIQERLAQVRGQAEFYATAQGFHTRLCLPETL